MPATLEERRELIRRIVSNFHAELIGQGVTERRLAEQLAKEMEAKRDIRLKVRGDVDHVKAERARVVARSYAGERDPGETVIEFTEDLWNIQQQARQDAQKLFDLYPAERHQVDVDKNITVVIREFKDSEPDEGKASDDKPD
jgi:hypothetical protein